MIGLRSNEFTKRDPERGVSLPRVLLLKESHDMTEETKNPHWEPLGGEYRVLVTAEHGFTTDTLLLAHFSLPRHGEACADFGTGCGAIPLRWKLRGSPGKILAVELQEEAAALARQTVAENGLSGEIEIVQGDLRDYKPLLPHQGLQLAACNPPYFPMGRGAPGDGARRTARHSETLTLQELAQAARYTLGWGGRLCVCLPTERLTDALETFRQNELEPKRLRLVQSTPEKAPYLFLLECRRGGRPGLEAEPTLILTDGEGKFTQEMQTIYGGAESGY